jgi:macrolide transport system ATP-binding/permease protein
MKYLFRDLRYSFRRLLSTPGFTLIVIISLSLGIGANSAIFSIVNAIFFQTLSVNNPKELIAVFPNRNNTEYVSFSYPNYLSYKDGNTVFSSLMAYQSIPLNLSSNGRAERVWGEIVTGNYFGTLGITTLKGRTLVPEDDKNVGAHQVVVISYGLWQRLFGKEDIIGQILVINGYSFNIIGVAPQDFIGIEKGRIPDLWIPMAMQHQVVPGPDRLKERGMGWLRVVGRLNKGITIEHAQAELRTLASQLAKDYPQYNKGVSISLFPAGQVHPEFQSMLGNFLAFLVAVLIFVLLIACVNTATLLMTRATLRQKETAIRLSIGATRAQLIRQLLTESVLLALAGGTVGLIFAYWITKLLIDVRPPTPFPIHLNFRLNTSVLVFTFLLSVLTGIIFGLVPALKASNPNLVSALKQEMISLGPVRRFSFINILVIIQIALSLILLIGAGLFIQSLRNAQFINPGFTNKNILLTSLDVGLQGYNETKGRDFYQQVSDRIGNLPGVKSVSIANLVPLSLAPPDADVFAEGSTLQSGSNGYPVDFNIVDEKYFQTLGISILQGRNFNNQDNAGSPGVVIINRRMANRFWPNQDAIGKRISLVGPSGPYLQVIGIVNDGKYRSLGEKPRSYFYLPLLQNYSNRAVLHIHTSGNPKTLINSVRDEVLSLDSNLPIFDIKSMEDHLTLSLFPAKIAATVLSGFGLVALLLAGIGIYGVMAYSVSQQTREIGIRIALGALSKDIYKMVIKRALIIITIGMLIGILGAIALMHLLSSLLYGISATDPLTFALIILLLIVIALVACFKPTYKSTTVDPLIALKHE